MTNNVQTPRGNTTTAGAVEQLAMARRVYAQFILDNVPGAGPDDVPKFDDNAHGVKIALAAIIEMSTRVIELEAENDRLSKAVGGGLLGDLLADDEKDEFVKFIKFLRGQEGQKP